MTRRQTTTRWALAILIALGIASAHLLDGPDDSDAAHEVYTASSQALRDLQAGAPATARREAAARLVCLEARGPDATTRWTPEGHLVCGAHSRITTLNHLPSKEARL